MNPIPNRASSVPADTSRTDCRHGRILIVDDRPENLLTLEATLAPLGHEIDKAGSGSEALRALLQHDYAVVLLDVNMPDMDGFETAQTIRVRRRNQATPIIFLTSYEDEMHALHGYSLGAVDFIQMPLVPEVLRSKVDVFVQLYERTHEVRQQADRLLQRTRQLQELTRASLRIHAGLSIEETLRVAADAARQVVGTRWAGAVMLANQYGIREHQFVASPEQHLVPGPRAIAENEVVQFVAGLSKSARLGPADLAAPTLRNLMPGSGVLPITGVVALLVGRDGNNAGLLVIAGKRHGEFNDDDEALLVQLAQMTATAVENTLFAEARESNRIKDEFLATLSHELRTPLSSILGWAQLLRTQMLDADETQEALEIIERNSEIQCNLIEELLDISRIITGKMQLNFRPINLVQVVQAAVNVIRPAAQAKQVSIDVMLDPQADNFHGDANRLQQVFWNLLSNAVKFTPPGGHIDVTLEAEGSQSRIIVADNGEGIAPDFLPHVFDRFRQADSTTSRRHGGLGIGLAIVRHVVELHGGTVRAESAGKGRGAAMVVSLPVASSFVEPAGSSLRMDQELHDQVAEPESEPVRAPG
jgi:signal transduction histidine kinase/DNA-binding response OmpR family regulator